MSKLFFPRDMTVGDYNEDGQPDIAVASDDEDAVSVFLGRGNGTFEPELRFPGVRDPESIATGDLNGDGHLDLVAVNAQPDTFTILLGLGNGAFRDARVFAAGSGTESVAISDFNGDGRLDLVTTGGRLPDAVSPERNGPAISVLLGQGDGTFGGPRAYAVDDNAEHVVTGYFNDDDWLDLAAIKPNTKSASLFLGNGDGTFESVKAADGSTALFDIGGACKWLAAGDLDRDGRPDLVGADQTFHTVNILWGSGGGLFEGPQQITVDTRPIGLLRDASLCPVLLEDFNADGNLDAALLDELDGEVVLLLGNGDRTFKPEARVAAGYGPGAFVASDVNRDGHLDLIVGNRYSHDISVLLGNGDGTFQPQSRFAGGQEPQPELRVDVNGDGRLDQVQADDNTDSLSVRISTAAGLVPTDCIATEIRATPLLADLNQDAALDAVQINQQGDILVRFGRTGQQTGEFAPAQVVNPRAAARDVAVVVTRAGTFLAAVNQAGDSVTLYLVAKSGRISTAYTLKAGGSPTRIAARDLNADGQDDLAVVSGDEPAVSVFLAGRAGKFTKASSSVPVGSGAAALTLVDVGDRLSRNHGAIDIIVPCEGSGDVSILINDGKGNFSSERELRLRASQGPYGTSHCASGSVAVYSRVQTSGVATGDFNEDGLLDLVSTNRGINGFSLLLGKPGGGFADPVAFPAGTGPTEVRAADFDRDGHLDLAVLNPSAGTVTIYRGDGRGHFAESFSTDAGNSSNGLALRDVDRDGNVDLLVGNESGDLLVLPGRGNGTFEPFQRAERGVALAVADLNGDGREEAIVANETWDRITVGELGEGDAFKPYFRQGREDGLLAPGAVAAADLNGDRLQDILVANRGGNSVLVYLGTAVGNFAPARSFFTGMSPSSLTVGDANDDGRLDVLVTNEGSNDVSVLLGDSQSLLRPGVRLNVGRGPVDSRLADANHDGTLDLLVTNGDDDNAMLLLGRGGGFFDDQHPVIYPTGHGPVQVQIGQFDASPGLDFVTINYSSNDLTFYSNFSLESGTTISSVGTSPIDAAVSDLDLDSFDDLLIANRGDGTVSLLWGGAEGLGEGETIFADLPSLTGLELDDSEFQGGLTLWVCSEGDDNPRRVDFTWGGDGPLPLRPTTETFVPNIDGSVAWVTGPSPTPDGRFLVPDDWDYEEGRSGEPSQGTSPKWVDHYFPITDPNSPETEAPDGLEAEARDGLTPESPPLKPPTLGTGFGDWFTEVVREELTKLERKVYSGLEKIIAALGLPIAPEDIYDAVACSWRAALAGRGNACVLLAEFVDRVIPELPRDQPGIAGLTLPPGVDSPPPEPHAALAPAVEPRHDDDMDAQRNRLARRAASAASVASAGAGVYCLHRALRKETPAAKTAARPRPAPRRRRFRPVATQLYS